MVYNGRSKGKMKSRGMGTKAGRRPPASRSLKAVVTPDVSPESPFDGMSMFGSLLICDPSVGNTRNYVSFEDLDEFCNAKFDIDRFYDEVYTRSERDVATYIRMYGALAVEVRGALIIAGHEQIVREYGYDDPLDGLGAGQSLPGAFLRPGLGEGFVVAVVLPGEPGVVAELEGQRGFVAEGHLRPPSALGLATGFFAGALDFGLAALDAGTFGLDFGLDVWLMPLDLPNASAGICPYSRMRSCPIACLSSFSLVMS